MIESYIESIVLYSKIQSIYKLSLAEVIVENGKLFNILNAVCKEMLTNNDISITIKISAIIRLAIATTEYKENCKNYLLSLLQTDRIDINFRYKTILSIEKNKKLIDFAYYTIPLLLYFANEETIDTMHRLLACQNLLANYKELDFTQIESFLISYIV